MSRAKARRICTAAEFALVSDSLPPQIKNLDRKAVLGRIARVRRLRDKYRRLSAVAVRAARGKTAGRRTRPARSVERAQAKFAVFSETLVRFEARLSRLPSRAPLKQTRLARKALAAKRAAGESAARLSTRRAGSGMTAKPGPAAKGFFPAVGAKRGELSAAVRRGQAKRDARR